jgi:DTW domain-containing protein YfiP
MRYEICLCQDASLCQEYLKNQTSYQTRVIIYMHHRERHLTTNTARIAQLCLPDCDVRLRGLTYCPIQLEGVFEENRQSLLLYPSEDATELSKDYVESFKKPLTLVVPDGSWRQASKLYRREEALSAIPRVKIPQGALSEYKLRREPKKYGLATFEAIARALGHIEGKQVQEPLEKVFKKMVKLTLLSRGQKIESSNILKDH